MRLSINCCYSTPLLCFSLITVGLASSTFITAFGSLVVSHGRLLQATAPCPIDFKSQNYTIITSKCKEPNYEPKPCCSSFKEFACTFADAINDPSTDCAQVMFKYINLAGKYPKGLFSSICREGRQGLACPDESSPVLSSPPPTRSNNCGGNGNLCELLLLTMIIVASFTTFVF